MICLVNQGSQVRFPASPEILSVEPSGVPVIKYTHKNYKPSWPSTSYYPGKSYKKFLKEKKKRRKNTLTSVVSSFILSVYSFKYMTYQLKLS